MYSLRVDASMRILWATPETAAAGVRVGTRVGACRTTPVSDAVEFARRVSKALHTGQEQSYRSSIGSVLIVPSDDQTVTAYLVPDSLEVGSEANDLDTQADDLVMDGEAVA